MANPCTYTYKGKKYSYEEFATMLHDGGLHELANKGIIQGDFVNAIPEALKLSSAKEQKGPINEALVKVNQEKFGLNEEQAKANAVVMEKTIETMAERAGISKEEMFDKISFEKGDAETAKNLSEEGQALFQIIGQNAKLSSETKQFLSDAKKMEANGVDPKDIYLQTGWEKGADGKWKYDMHEGKVEFKKESGSGTMEEVLDYPELFEKYPDAKNIQVVFNNNMNSEGLYDSKRNRIFINTSSGMSEAKLTLLHEVQHWIQNKEGFSKGSSPESARASIEAKIEGEKNPSIKTALTRFRDAVFSAKPKEMIDAELSRLKKILNKDDYDMARAVAGEAEARNVEERFGMTAEDRKATPLSETEDVARDEQVVLFQGEQGAMLARDGKFIIYALTNPNVTTPLHELGHVYEHYLTDAERNTILENAGHTEWGRDTSEHFARGFEKYLSDGKAPSPEMKTLFDNFKNWLTNIYSGITGSDIDIKLSPEMTKIFDEMLGTKSKENETAPSQNTPTDGNVRPGTTGMDQNRISDQEDNKAGSIQSADNNQSINEENENVIFNERDEFDNLLSGEAEQRRRDGKYTRDGVEYVRQDPKDNPTGNKTTVKFADEVEVEVEYALMESSDVQPSHLNGKRNPDFFITEAQPKNRKDSASIQASDKIGKNPKLSEAGENSNAYSGAPVVNERGEVIQGNNRAEGLKKHYSNNGSSYKQQLIDSAEKFGLTKEQVEGMKNPILVRKAKVDDARAIQLGNYDVKDIETGGTRRIDPVATSRRIPSKDKSALMDILFGSNENATLNESIRQKIDPVIGILKKYLNQAQIEGILSKDGQLKQKGVEDLENLFQHFLFENGNVNLPEQFESLSSRAKNGIFKSLPKILSLPSSKSLLTELQNAIGAAHSFINSGNTNLKLWLNQGDIFNDNKTPADIYSELELELVDLLINAKTEAQIKKVFAEYNELVNGKEADMFTEKVEGVSKKEAVKQKFNLDIDKNEQSRQEVKSVSSGENRKRNENNEKPNIGSKNKKQYTAEEKQLDSMLDQLTDDELIQMYNEQVEYENENYADKRKKIGEISEGSNESQDNRGGENQSQREEETKTNETEPSTAGEPGSFERKQGKKSLLGRAATGNSKTVKQAIKDYSLDYEIENQEIAKQNAEKFVDEVGIEAARDAVKKGLIVGAEKAFVYNKIIEDITNNIENVPESERTELEKINVEILGEMFNEFDQAGREAGRFIAALGKIYNGSAGRYNLTKQVADYKAMNNGVIPDDVLIKFKEADIKIKELEAKISELQIEKQKQEAQNSFNNIVEDIARKSKLNQNKGISNKQKAKDFANKLRSFKTSQKGTLSAATPISLAYDASIEIAATVIEAGGTIADAIKKGLDNIRNQNISDSEKSQAVQQFINAFDQTDGGVKSISIDKNGKIKIPHSYIREKVENGIDNIEDLVRSIQEDVNEMFPDETFDERDIRDAVTNYGKTINPTKDDIEIQIGIMKSMGRLISGLEDAYSGKRPLKSGLQRRPLTLEERKMQRRLKDLLRDLPMDDADLSKAWKTALDAIKARLTNQIADLDDQIKNKEKRKPERNQIQYDEEANALRNLRDEKRAYLDELVGKPELTEEQKIDKAVKLTEAAIEKIQEKITTGEIDYKTKPNPVTSAKLEALRATRKDLQKQLNEMREDAGLVEMKRLESAKKYRKNRLDELQRRIKEKDFSKKEPKPLPVDEELLALDAELQTQKDIYEKEKYLKELEDMSRYKKMVNHIANAIGVTRLLKAGGEFSSVLVQLGFLTPQILVTNPKEFFKGIAKLGAAFAMPDVSQRYENELKSDPLYPLMKKTKTSITGTDYKLDAQEENFQVDLVTNAWNKIGDAIDKATGNREVKTFAGIIKSLMGKELSESDRKTFGTQFKEMSIWKSFERGAVAYSNHIKMVKFKQGVLELQKQGKDPINDLEDYKKVANYINVFSGRASLGKLEQATKEASLIVFSLRNTVSQIQQLNPLFYLKTLGDYSDIKSFKDLKNAKPTVAQKMAVKSFMTSVTSIVGFKLAFMAAANAASDDDDEKWRIETDPRSSDFGKLRKGDSTFDMWHGLNSLVVLYSRLLSQQTKSTKTDEITKLGEGYGNTTSSDLMVRYATNKLAPTAGLLWRLGNTTEKIDTNTGKSYRVDKYGNVFGEDEYWDMLVPIYWGAVTEIKKDDPDAFEGFLAAMGVLGMSVGTDKQGIKFKDIAGPQEKSKDDERSERSERKERE